MSKPLFDASDESDNDTELKLGTNEEYAKSFNSFRKKELLKKLKDRGYNNVTGETDTSDDSESSEEDENLDEDFDRDFFKTLASLKSKDPAIYDKNTKFFEDNAAEVEEDDNEKSTKKAKKPVTLKDYERKVIVEHGGKFEDDSDAESVAEATKRPASPTVVEEERRLKAEFKQVLEADDSADEEFGGIFTKRVKSNAEKTQEETDFAEWLAGKKADIEASAKQKLEPLKNYWNQRNLPQSERFLRDYILNKGYTDTKSADIPTYEEIVGEDEQQRIAALSDDERELEKQAEFEEQYNFRFEEPDTDFIKRFPRTIENSVRQTDGKRKEKRQELKERKQAEKEQKMKGIEMLKEMKRKEIEEKIEKLKKVTGNDELGFKDDELEEDFDPAAHDRRMREIFNDEYYEVDEGEEKPECPSDIDELKVEDWDNYDPQNAAAYADGGDYDGAAHCEDDDFNMDCDYDPAAAKQQFQQELIANTKKRKNRRGRRNRFMEMIQQEKPAFDPEDEKTYGDYIDEYYKMDCEDIIADIPCRFKYVETTPNDFGLTIEEILLAKNKELNQWASLKKALQIRPEQVEKRDQKLYKMKARNEALKRKIFKSLYGEDNSGDEAESTEETEPAKQAQKTESAAAENQTKKKKPKKKRKNTQNNETKTATAAATENETAPKDAEAATIATLEATTTAAAAENIATNGATNVAAVTLPKKKRKNKRKNKQSNDTAAAAATNEPAAKKPKLIAENENAAKSLENTAPSTAPNENAAKTLGNKATPAAPNDKKKKKKKQKKKQQQQQQQNTTASQAAVATNTTKAPQPNKDNSAKPTSAPTATKSKNPFDQTNDKAPQQAHNNSTSTTDNATKDKNPFKAARSPGQAKLFANDSNNKMNGKPKFNGKSKFNSKSKPNFKPFNNKQRRKPFGAGGGGGGGGGDKRGRTTNAGGVKINDERLKAYNINPRKFHKKQKFGGKKQTI